MKYKVARTDKANDQLFDIIQYIADDSGDIQIALDYLEKIEKSNFELGGVSVFRTYTKICDIKKTGI